MYLEDASTVIVLKTPKNRKQRSQSVDAKTVAYILREWKASQDKQKEFLGSEYLDYNLVVALPNGRPCEETVISNAFRRLKRGRATSLMWCFILSVIPALPTS